MYLFICLGFSFCVCEIWRDIRKRRKESRNVICMVYVLHRPNAQWPDLVIKVHIPATQEAETGQLYVCLRYKVSSKLALVTWSNPIYLKAKIQKD